ncbi:hypothetical protein ABBQ38_008131 [Trebouxia sp. C0009 RCD-2024]
MALQDLEGQDKVAVIFDDSAHVWQECWDNLIPIPPYCFWQNQADRYWQCELLHSQAHVAHGYDERIEHGALSSAWDAAVSVLSSALLAPPSPSASPALPSMLHQDIRPHLVSKREQVLEGEAIYLMGFEGADLAIFQDRIILYGGEVMDNDRYCTTVLVRHSKFKTKAAQEHGKAAVRIEW